MAKGRKPLPYEIKELHGTIEKSRENFNTPSFGKVLSVNTAPSYFSKEEKKMYLQICQDLINANVLEFPDMEIVAKLVMENTRYYTVMLSMRQEGKYTEYDLKGNKIVCPENAIAASALRAIKSLSSELGLSPAARMRLKISVVTETEKKKSAMQILLD